MKTYTNSWSKDELTNILKMSTMFMDFGGRQFAKEMLPPFFPDMDIFRRFHMARVLKIPSWMKDTVTSLIRDIRLSQFRLEDCRELSDAFYVICITRDNIDRHRRRIALVPGGATADPAPSCFNHQACIHTWDSVWLKRVTPYVLNPDRPNALSSTEEFIRQLTFPSEMNVLCSIRMKELCLSVPSQPFHLEDAQIGDAADEICRMFDMEKDIDEDWDKPVEVKLIPSEF